MEPLGFRKALTLLAFDHRGSYGEKLFLIKGRAPNAEEIERMSHCKMIIYLGFEKAVQEGVSKESAAILVDEQYGEKVLADAQSKGYTVACPCEKSGQKEFDFEYGDAFGERIAQRNPVFTKILVRYNTGDKDNEEMNKRQLEKMKRLSDYLRQHKQYFMLELLVPATSAQLESVGGDSQRYDVEIRPNLMVEAIHAFQDYGIEADVWKLEGLDKPEDASRVAKACTRGEGRENVGVVILGRGANEEKVKLWLTNAAQEPTFIGFAVGRTIWWDALKGYLAGDLTQEQAVAMVAKNYSSLVDLWNARK